MGRKSTPTELKLLEGNPGKRKINKSEPKPEKLKGKLPPVPKEFRVKPVQDRTDKTGWEPPHPGTEAGLAFKKLSAELDALGLLTTVDVPALEAYCQAYGLWKTATAYVNRLGEMTQTPNGNIIQNPYLAVVNKQAMLMAKLGSEFGLTPSSRTGIDTGKGGEGDDFEQFLKRKA